jgi:hypothetical protein
MDIKHWSHALILCFHWSRMIYFPKICCNEHDSIHISHDVIQKRWFWWVWWHQPPCCDFSASDLNYLSSSGENKGCKGCTAQHLQFMKCPCAVTNDLHVTVLYTVFWPLVLASSTRRISCSRLRGDLLTTLCTVRRRVDHASLWNTIITVVLGRLLTSIVLFWHLHTPYREMCHFPCSEVTDSIAVWLKYSQLEDQLPGKLAECLTGRWRAS